MLKRALNVGFSGGEKKRMEILQMTVLAPRLAILDETDSGLDIDALRIVAEGVNAMRAPDRSMLVITHYQRLLDHIRPDRVHVLAGGRIVASGGPELALELEARGYDQVRERRMSLARAIATGDLDRAAVPARRGLALDRSARPDRGFCRRPRRTCRRPFRQDPSMAWRTKRSSSSTAGARRVQQVAAGEHRVIACV